MKSILIILFSIIHVSVFSQYIINIDYLFGEPFPATRAQYEANELNIFVTNTVEVPYKIYLKGNLKVENFAGGQIADISGPKDKPVSPHIEFDAIGAEVFSLKDMIKSVDEVEGIPDDFLQFSLDDNAKLPDGRYTLCLTAYDIQSDKQLSGTICSNTFTVNQGTIVVNMPESQTIDCTQKNGYTFTWTDFNIEGNECDYLVTIIDLTRLNLNEADKYYAISNYNSTPDDTRYRTTTSLPTFTLDESLPDGFIQDTNLYAISIAIDPCKGEQDLEYANENLSNVFTLKFVCNGDGDGTLQEDETNECIRNCRSISPANRNVKTTFNGGDVFKVGKFDVKITNISSSGDNLKGEGLIKIDFLNINLKVSFDNIQVNADNQLIVGVVKGMYQQSAPTLSIDGNFDLASVAALGTQLGQYFDANLNKLENAMSSEGIDLPLGIDQYLNGNKIIMGVVGMEFTDTIAKLNAIVNLDLADGLTDYGWFSLAAKDLAFNPEGINIGAGNIFNPEDKEIPFNNPLGDDPLKNGKLVFNKYDGANKGTYVEWDCQGFKRLHVEGRYEFANTLIKHAVVKGDPTKSKKLIRTPGQSAPPSTPITNSTPSDKVSATFSFDINNDNKKNLNDILIQADMTSAFEIVDLPGWAFEVDSLVFDLSVNENATSVKFPENYSGALKNNKEWKGFYLDKVYVAMPDDFKGDDDNDGMIIFQSDKLIIDGSGFTCDFKAIDVIKKEKAKVDKWAFSVDTIRLKITQSNFDETYAKGEIKVPIFDKAVNYGLSVSQESQSIEYSMQVLTDENIKHEAFDKWAAFVISKNSSIGVYGIGTSVRADAKIHGALNLQPQGNLKWVGTHGAKFTNFKLSSKSPHFDKGTWSLASDQHEFNGLPITLDTVELEIKTGEKFLFGPKFTASLDLAKSEDDQPNSFNSTIRFSVLFELYEENEEQKVKFDKVEVDSLKVGGDIGIVSFNAGLAFYNGDATYGNGFSGEATVKVKEICDISAWIYFGKKEELDYFGIGGFASLSTPISLFAGVAIRGFGGGVYYHMTDTNGKGTLKQKPTLVPTDTTSLGFYAQVKLGNSVSSAPAAEPYIINAALGAELNSSWGFDKIYLKGDLFVMTKNEEPDLSDFYANINLEFTFNPIAFHGDCDMYVNAARTDKEALVRGNASGNPNSDYTGYAGKIYLHFDDKYWQVLLGEPNKRIGIGIKATESIQIDFTAYLMTGSSIPAMGGYPKEITDFMSISNENLPSFSGPSGGFAFGAEARMDLLLGKKDNFYVDAKMILGLNIGVYNNLTCNGFNPVGFNGWYAMGNLYLYFKGELGVPVLGPVVSLEAAAGIRGAFANPSYLVVDLKLEIETAIYSGDWELHETIGEKCDLDIESPIKNLPLIQDLSPADASNNVPVYGQPQLSLTYGYKVEVRLPTLDKDGNNITRVFRTNITKFEIKKGSEVFTAVQDFEEGTEDKIVTLKPQSIFLPNTTYTIIAEVEWQEKIGNSWSIAKTKENVLIKESRSYSFTTGAMPDKLNDHLVKFTLPYENQQYYLQNEAELTMIVFNQDLNGANGGGNMFPSEIKSKGITQYYSYFIRIAEDNDEEGTVMPITFNKYKNANGQVSQAASPGAYGIQVRNLKNSSTYKMQLIRKKQNLAQIVQNQNQFAGLQNFSAITLDNGQKVFKFDAVKTNQIFDHIMYETTFKTSKYNSLLDKVTNMKAEYSHSDGLKILTNENFDAFDTINLAIVQLDDPQGYFAERKSYFYSLRGYQPHGPYRINVKDFTCNQYKVAIENNIMEDTYNSINLRCDGATSSYLIHQNIAKQKRDWNDEINQMRPILSDLCAKEYSENRYIRDGEIDPLSLDEGINYTGGTMVSGLPSGLNLPGQNVNIQMYNNNSSNSYSTTYKLDFGGIIFTARRYIWSSFIQSNYNILLNPNYYEFINVPQDMKQKFNFLKESKYPSPTSGNYKLALSIMYPKPNNGNIPNRETSATKAKLGNIFLNYTIN